MKDFQYSTLEHSVYFGQNSFSKLPGLLNQFEKSFVIGEKRVLPQVQQLVDALGKEKIFHFSEVIQHVPQQLVDKALAVFQNEKADALVAIGGGSAIGLVKAIALQTGIPIVAVPTTYAGSEMTNIWGISNEEGKTTGRDKKVMPKHVFYDPQFTASMPYSLAASSAMNAMAHLIEALYAHDNNPLTYNNSLMGILRLREGMQGLAENKDQKLHAETNQLLQFGAYLAGKALGEVSIALHHKIAHVLGGSFGVEHSHAHSIMQPYVLEYQWNSLSASIKNDFVKAFNHEYPPQALLELATQIGVPTTLKDIDFKEEDIPKVADITLTKPYPNPAPLEQERLVEMLNNAYAGKLTLG